MKNATAYVPYKTWGYGAVELKMGYQSQITKSLLFAVLLNFGSIGTYYALGSMATYDEPPKVVTKGGIEIHLPPPLWIHQTTPRLAVILASVAPIAGIWVPVPDAEVNPDQTVATQTDLSAVDPASTGEQVGDGLIGYSESEADRPPPIFVPYEVAPVAIRKIKPVFPEIALRAGIEGTVYVKMWVDKEGKVRKVVILKSDAEIFNQCSIDAGMKFLFTPAIMQKGPVAVWVAFPFRFKLTGK